MHPLPVDAWLNDKVAYQMTMNALLHFLETILLILHQQNKCKNAYCRALAGRL